jgi:hypothetical protein
MTSLRTIFAMGSVFLLGASFDSPKNGILFRESFTVPAQETYSGNLIAVESTVRLEEGSTFDGNMILVGGSMESAGKIIGDIASVGASIHFASPSILSGNAVCIGTAPQVDAGAGVTGTIHTLEGFSLPNSPTAENTQETGSAAGKADFWYEVTIILFRMFLLSAVATLIFLFLPSPAERVARTIVEKPAVSFLIGLLTMMAAAALFLLLALTVCLSPLSLLGSIILLVAILLGWVALGWEIGVQVCGMLRMKAHPAVVAGIGTIILTLIASGLGFVPWAGPILILLVLSFGLGAVVLTRFGGPNVSISAESAGAEKE